MLNICKVLIQVGSISHINFFIYHFIFTVTPDKIILDALPHRLVNEPINKYEVAVLAETPASVLKRKVNFLHFYLYKSFD